MKGRRVQIVIEKDDDKDLKNEGNILLHSYGLKI